MKMIETLAVVNFGPGAMLTLSADQVRRRQRVLRDMGDGVYEALDHVQFKSGEVFGYDGVLSKSMLALVKVDGQSVAPPPAAVPPAGPVKFVMPVARDIPPGAKKRK